MLPLDIAPVRLLNLYIAGAISFSKSIPSSLQIFLNKVFQSFILLKITIVSLSRKIFL